jgi:hypothetical protein
VPTPPGTMYLNRVAQFAPSELVIPPLDVAAVWVFGAIRPDRSRWAIWGNLTRIMAGRRANSLTRRHKRSRLRPFRLSATHGADSGTDSANRVFQRLQILLTGFPENGRIRFVVIVTQNVADTGDGLPSDAWLLALQLDRQASAGLGNDLEIPFDQLPRTPVGTNFSKSYPAVSASMLAIATRI